MSSRHAVRYASAPAPWREHLEPRQALQGWTDVALSAEGVLQAQHAGRVLQAIGCTFDVCFTSMLARATDTLRLTLQTMGLSDVPIRQSWRLNERHYGALQGLTLWQGVRRYGPRRVLGCQRRFAVPPPLLKMADPRFPGLDPRYADLAPSQLPRGESVADTQRRVLPCWHEEIAPALRAGQRVLVVSHRNTLRALRKLLEGVADADTQKLKVPHEPLDGLRARRRPAPTARVFPRRRRGGGGARAGSARRGAVVCFCGRFSPCSGA